MSQVLLVQSSKYRHLITEPFILRTLFYLRKFGSEAGKDIKERRVLNSQVTHRFLCEVERGLVLISYDYKSYNWC